MCGRYCITSAPEAIRALFRYREQPNFPARYNVAPTQPVPAINIIYMHLYWFGCMAGTGWVGATL